MTENINDSAAVQGRHGQAAFPDGWDAVVVSITGIHASGDRPEDVWENARHYWSISAERADEIAGRAATDRPVLLIPLWPGSDGAKNQIAEVFQLAGVVPDGDKFAFVKADRPIAAVENLRDELVGRELITAVGAYRRPQRHAYIGAWND